MTSTHSLRRIKIGFVRKSVIDLNRIDCCTSSHNGRVQKLVLGVYKEIGSSSMQCVSFVFGNGRWDQET